MLDTICGVSKLKIWDTKASEPLHKFELEENLEAQSRHIIETLQDWAFMAQRMALYGNGESWQKAFLDTICSRQKGFRYKESKFIDAKAEE
jgi:hypothetical protein